MSEYYIQLTHQTGHAHPICAVDSNEHPLPAVGDVVALGDGTDALVVGVTTRYDSMNLSDGVDTPWVKLACDRRGILDDICNGNCTPERLDTFTDHHPTLPNPERHSLYDADRHVIGPLIERLAAVADVARDDDTAGQPVHACFDCDNVTADPASHSVTCQACGETMRSIVSASE